MLQCFTLSTPPPLLSRMLNVTYCLNGSKAVDKICLFVDVEVESGLHCTSFYTEIKRM